MSEVGDRMGPMMFHTCTMRQAAMAVCARDGVDLGELPAAGLLELSGDVARLRRIVDVMMAEVAGEVRRRSETVEGAGLASRQGFRSAGELLAQATGGTVAEAKRLMRVGDLLADGAGVMGADATGAGLSPLAQFRVCLAEAVREGRISVEGAGTFTVAIETLPDTERTQALFGRALAKAPGLSLHQVRKLVLHAQALSDPIAWEEREDRQYEARAVTVRDDADGMVLVTARLTPLMAAPVRAVLDAGVRWALQARRDDPDSDRRTAMQMRADILSDLCRHALDCTHATTGVKTTVIIRMNRADLEAGVGVGEIDGLPQPISVKALRQAAVDAEVIPVLLGGPSDILDWGRKRRLFTEAQRLALGERDGGCAWCNAPPSWSHAHHIRWWERDAGPTDLSNGVLLCTACHTRLHRDGWDIEVEDQVVYFIPPRTIDPARTPRPGGRERYDVAA